MPPPNELERLQHKLVAQSQVGVPRDRDDVDGDTAGAGTQQWIAPVAIGLAEAMLGVVVAISCRRLNAASSQATCASCRR